MPYPYAFFGLSVAVRCRVARIEMAETRKMVAFNVRNVHVFRFATDFFCTLVITNTYQEDEVGRLCSMEG